MTQTRSMAGDSAAAQAQLHRLSTRRDNLAALVSRLSTVDALSSGVAALELMLQVNRCRPGPHALGESSMPQSSCCR